MKDKYFFHAIWANLLIVFCLINIVSLFSLENCLSIFWGNIFRNFPLYNNVLLYSDSPFDTFSLFFYSLVMFPFNIIYFWLKIPDTPRYRIVDTNYKRILVGILSMLITMSTLTFMLFLYPENLSDRRVESFILLFQNQLGIMVFIFPLFLLSIIVSGMMKFFYLYFKFKL